MRALFERYQRWRLRLMLRDREPSPDELRPEIERRKRRLGAAGLLLVFACVYDVNHVLQPNIEAVLKAKRALMLYSLPGTLQRDILGDVYRLLVYVRANRIYEISGEDILQPGFRLIQGYERLKELIYRTKL